MKKGIESLPKPYNKVVETLLEALLSLYHDNLVSLLVYGSVARGDPRKDSDIDLLVVFESLPLNRPKRLDIFNRAYDVVDPLILSLMDQGYYITLSPIIKSKDEASHFTPQYLDMIDDAVIVYDKDSFMEKVLNRISEELKKLGAKRVWLSNKAWYWVLKPDYKFGDVIEIE
ncbi:nucleotidyltransferase domain-containing protein [Sulfolobus tengchongensis]|uniref:Nucleotidyltransferase domain-containing protein n=1 Tax=Sulfolobus tengchongensis TaxID=207809 RepID=A0AAX4KZG8_9CREN